MPTSAQRARPACRTRATCEVSQWFVAIVCSTLESQLAGLHSMKLSVIVPVYNEAATASAILEQIQLGYEPKVGLRDLQARFMRWARDAHRS